MRFFIKLVLLAGILVFALWNYRVISFDKGISKTSFEDKDVIEVLTTLTDITKVEYYKNPFEYEDSDSSDKPNYIYNVYIETTKDAYLLGATQEAVDIFSGASLINRKYTPNKITPIPYYVYIIVGVIILVIPFGRRKRRRRYEDE